MRSSCNCTREARSTTRLTSFWLIWRGGPISYPPRPCVPQTLEPPTPKTAEPTDAWARFSASRTVRSTQSETAFWSTMRPLLHPWEGDSA